MLTGPPEFGRPWFFHLGPSTKGEHSKRPSKKKTPKFESEDEERNFWATHNSTEYVSWTEGTRVTLPNLKPSTRTISIRLPESLLERLKLLANQRDVPYQSLLKIFLAERVDEENRSG